MKIKQNEVIFHVMIWVARKTPHEVEEAKHNRSHICNYYKLHVKNRANSEAQKIKYWLQEAGLRVAGITVNGHRLWFWSDDV